MCKCLESHKVGPIPKIFVLINMRLDDLSVEFSQTLRDEMPSFCYNFSKSETVKCQRSLSMKVFR